MAVSPRILLPSLGERSNSPGMVWQTHSTPQPQQADYQSLAQSLSLRYLARSMYLRTPPDAWLNPTNWGRRAWDSN